MKCPAPPPPKLSNPASRYVEKLQYPSSYNNPKRPAGRGHGRVQGVLCGLGGEGGCRRGSRGVFPERHRQGRAEGERVGRCRTFFYGLLLVVVVLVVVLLVLLLLLLTTTTTWGVVVVIIQSVVFTTRGRARCFECLLD